MASGKDRKARPQTNSLGAPALPGCQVKLAPGGFAGQHLGIELMRRLLMLIGSDSRSRSGLPLRSKPSFVPNSSLALALALLTTDLIPSTLLAATLTATLDRETITVGETATLTLKVEGGEPQAMPTPPGIPNLQIAGQGTSRNISIVNGQQSSSLSQSFIITPRQPGDYVIPSLIAVVDAQRLPSSELKLKVLLTDPSAPPPEYAEKLAFLWLTLPKTEVFLGETLVGELRLYARGDVQNVSEPQIPALSSGGFTAGNFVQGQQYQRRVGTTPFTIIPLQVALTPIKTGLLAVGPLNGSVVAHVIPGGRRGRDPFENFFGPQTQAQRVPLTLEARNLQVKPLPATNVPPNFSGAVGNFTMAFSAGPTNVAVGDPITVKVQISGQGRLDAITLPDFGAWQDFKTYPPNTRVETTDQLGTKGSKFFEQIVVPQSTDIKELPSVSFSFFDTDGKSYRTVAQPAVPLIVRPGGAAAAPTVVTAGRPSQANSPPAQDIVPIKQRLGAVAQIGPPLVRQPWFLALQAIPLLAWILSLAWRKRCELLANNPRLRRQRKVARIIHDGLLELRDLAAKNKSDEFFAVLFRLLQEQLGERLDLPATAITEAVIEERLRPGGAPETILSALQDLFQTCNLARYAPIKSSQELAALIPKFESVLRELQELKL